jgi:hypothetical protein
MNEMYRLRNVHMLFAMYWNTLFAKRKKALFVIAKIVYEFLLVEGALYYWSFMD